MALTTLNPSDTPQKFEQAVRTEMAEHTDHFEKELAKLRTGRAHTALVEDIHAFCYGSMMRIKDIASITAPDAQTLVIQPWDLNNLGAIEKAVSQSDLNVNPANDGAILRIQLPPMSAARRDELIKTIGKKLEETRIAIRNVRKEVNNIIRDFEKNKAISEDIAKRLQTALQKATDEMTAKAEASAEKKEKEIKTL